MNVNVITDRDAWILSKCAYNSGGNSVSVFEPSPSADINYYVHWVLYISKPVNTKCLLGITHLDGWGREIEGIKLLPNVWFTAMSNQWRDYAIDHGIPSNRIFLNEFGFDNSLFTFRDKIKSEKKTVAIVGRKYETGRKGEKVLLEIAKMMSREFRFLFIGDRRQEEVDALRHMGFEVIYKRNILDNELPDALAEADVLLLTSLREGGPCTALEALGMGIPVVSTPVGYVIDIVEECQVCGEIYQHKDHLSAVAAIERFATEPSRDIRRSEAVQRYSWAEYKNRARAIYNEICGGYNEKGSA